MINKVILVGNVGADPEVKHIDQNTSVATFNLATSESYTDKQGVKQTRTEWHRIVAWRGLADIMEKYVRKGSMLYVEGRLQYRTYDDANGAKKYITEIVADTIKMLDRRNNPNGAAENSNGQAASEAIAAQVEEIESAGTDDLPF